MASQTTSLLILLIIVSAVADVSSYSHAVLPNTSLTATEGSCVEIICKVTGTLIAEDALWFWMKDGTWNKREEVFTGTIVYSNKITEQPISPSFKGRVKYKGSQQLAHSAICSIVICNLKTEDSGTYFFRYIPKEPKERWKTEEDVVLTVQINCPFTFDEPKPVMESSTITLQCSTVPLCYSGLFIESVLPSGFNSSTSDLTSATLSFVASWEDDGREFICQRKGNLDIHLAKKTTVTVQYAPSVQVKVISPSPSFTQDETVTLTCEVIRSSPPPHWYTWYKNENPLSSGQMYVKNLQPEDSGSYTCSATNTVNTTRSSSFQINVHYKPRNTYIESVGQIREVAVGRSVFFKCNTDANPPAGQYSWHRVSDQPLSEHSTQPTAENSLELRSVPRADEVCYSCSATNSVGAGDKSTYWCIKVIYPPTQMTMFMDREVKEGQRITITCRVDSSPKSILTLSRKPEMNPLETLQEVTGNTLSYSFNVTSVHAGVYTCHAQNHLGSNSTRRQLQVKYRPKHVTVQADPGLAVKENMTLRLSCSAQSNPPVTSVTWTTIIRQNRTEHKGLTFTVQSVTPNDSGLYSCTAYNDIGQGQSQQAVVKVKFAPKHMKVLSAVEAQTPDGTRSVTLSCSSHSYPPVSQYTWYRKTDDQVFKVSENINYTVPSTDPGVYYCTARNEVGERRSEPVRLFLDGGYVKFIFLTLGLLLIVLVAVFVFRLKRKKSVEGGSATSSWSCSRFMGRWTSGRTEPGQTEPCRNNPGPQQRAEIPNGTSSINPVYSTVNLPEDKQGQGATREQHRKGDSLNYASLHFEKKKTSMPPKPTADIVYSTVKTPKAEMSEVYENVKTVQRCPNLMLSDSDSSEDEVDVSYTQVNFRNKARCKEAPRLSEEAEAQYSELKF